MMTAAEKRPISIDSLHQEILWFIFSLNADVQDDFPLKTAHHTSQVSGLWRKIMVTAPTIWGKSLALYELQIQKALSPWRDLVMERTGSAPLFFKGEISPYRVERFLEFISPYWERICEIDVQPWGLPTDNVYEAEAKFLNTPPLSIRAFHLPRVRFDLQAPWVANLRSLGLSTPFSVNEILTCLANMPRLEDAKFEQWTAAFETGPFHLNAQTRPLRTGKIPLPHLINLRLSHYLSEVTDILDHITPNEECAYNISTMEHPFSSDAQWDLLFEYIERRINLRNDITLNLDVQRHSVMFRIAGDPSAPAFIYNHSTDLQQTPDNAVKVHLSRFYYLRNTPGGTGSSLRNLMSRKVTALAIYIDDEWHRGMDRSIKNFTDFCLSFPFVSTLELSRTSLIFLRHIISESAIFPSLETLKVSANSKGQQRYPALELMVADVLNSRRSSGKPIGKLCFHRNIVELRLDWGFLEDFKDMKVFLTSIGEEGTYGESVYVCGSGNPGRLDMRNGWEGLDWT